MSISLNQIQYFLCVPCQELQIYSRELRQDLMEATHNLWFQYSFSDSASTQIELFVYYTVILHHLLREK